MKCQCGREVYRITSIWVKGKEISFCKYCRDKQEFLPIDNKEYQKTDPATGASVAHIKDIKSRKTDWKTGEVYRVKNKTYFT